jgi:hypothetical protein
MYLFIGVLAEESGRIPPVASRKAFDTAERTLMLSLKSRHRDINENEIERMKNITHGFDIW